MRMVSKSSGMRIGDKIYKQSERYEVP